MAESINRYFQMLPMFAGNSKPSGKLRYPAADVYETPEGWLVKVELAGISLDDIEIEVEGNSLYVAGTRRDHSCNAQMTYRQMEITYSRFEKNLQFPRSIDGAKLEYDYKDGLLIINLRAAKE